MGSKFRGIGAEISGYVAKFVFPSKTKTEYTGMERPFHIHFDSEVHFILGGSYLLVTEKGKFELEKNSICIIPKGISHDMRLQKGCGKTFNMLISVKRNKNSAAGQKTNLQVWQQPCDIEIFQGCEKICGYIKDFMESGDHNEYVSKSIMVLVLFGLTDLLIKRYPCTSEVAKVCDVAYDGSFFDAELESYFMTHYKQKLTRDKVARELGISSSQLGRIIKKNYSVSYNELITALRMVEAKKLIKQNLSLAEIAKTIGYTTYNGFAAAFRRYYGMAPEKMKKGEKA